MVPREAWYEFRIIPCDSQGQRVLNPIAFSVVMEDWNNILLIDGDPVI